MSKINCWEFYSCGKEEGGVNVGPEGPCPASTFEAANNFMGGKNGGRACAYIAGTFCSQTLEGTQRNFCQSSLAINQFKLCTDCDFYHLLRKEEKDKFSLHNFLLYIKNKLMSSKMDIGKIEIPHWGKRWVKSKQSVNN